MYDVANVCILNSSAMTKDNDKLYILLISVHGLIRANNLELGRDADTGGQIKYVIELARSLGEHPDVGHVDLITQRLEDSDLDDDYAKSLNHYQIMLKLFVLIVANPAMFLKRSYGMSWIFLPTILSITSTSSHAFPI